MEPNSDPRDCPEPDGASARARPAELLPLVYDELRRLAARHMRAERRGHTLCATELVHEAYLRLERNDSIDWKGRTHFLALAARSLRRILIEHARARAAGKRGGGLEKLTLDEGDLVVSGGAVELLALDEALNELARRSPRQAELVQLRFFGGLGVAEAAEVLGVGQDTAKADWRFARAWLNRRLASGEPPG